MVHNKPLDEGYIQERVEEFHRELTLELFPEIAHPNAVDPLARAFAELRVRAVILGDTRARLQPYVDAVRAAGGTWKQVAETLGLAQPSSAQWTYGDGHEDRAEKLRKRQAASRRSAPKEPLPGLSAVDAGEILGIDARTVKTRGKKGEIRTVTIKSSSGNDRVRYILD